MTIHGKDAVRVSAVDQDESDERTGQALIDALQASSARDFDLESPDFHGTFPATKL